MAADPPFHTPHSTISPGKSQLVYLLCQAMEVYQSLHRYFCVSGDQLQDERSESERLFLGVTDKKPQDIEQSLS